MEEWLGMLKIKVVRGIDLAVRDSSTSDPYVVASLGLQKTKTSVVKDTCNPVWNEELTITIKDPNIPVKLMVFDKDTFTDDDNMGEADIDIYPFIECMKMGLDLNHFPPGTTLDRVQPNKNNYLSQESCIVWRDGKISQEMILRLRNVECGEIQIEIEFVVFPGSKLEILPAVS